MNRPLLFYVGVAGLGIVETTVWAQTSSASGHFYFRFPQPAVYHLGERAAALHGPYAPQPDDQYFTEQWYLEQRNTNGAVTGPDLNVRAAWPYTRGEGVVVAVADLGVELVHPDLAPRVAGALNHNFNDSS